MTTQTQLRREGSLRARDIRRIAMRPIERPQEIQEYKPEVIDSSPKEQKLQEVLGEIRKQHGYVRSSGVHKEIVQQAERLGYSETQGRKIADEFFGQQRTGLREARHSAQQIISREKELQRKLGIYDGGKITSRVTQSQIEKLQEVKRQQLERQGYQGQSLVGGGELFTKPDIKVQDLRQQDQQRPISTISAVPEPEGILETLQADLTRKRLKLEQRGEGTIKEEVQAGALGFGKTILDMGLFGKQIITQPVTTTKEVGTKLFSLGGQALKGEAKAPQIGRMLRDEPSFAFGYILGEIGTGYAGGKVLTKVGDIASVTKTKFSLKYKPLDVETNLISDIPTTKGLKKIEIGGGVKTLSEPLTEQVKLAGKKVDAVSAQRDLFSIFQKKVVVDKPLPTPDAPQLEKSFFADPRGRLRPSRLGILDSDSASFSDILGGEVVFRRPKPQALLFPDVEVQRFPSNLRDIELKLKSGTPLSESDKTRLLNFQLEPSGQFKPVGFLSKEPEITLAPKEIIVKEGKVGVTIIKGRSVPIFEASIGQATESTSKLLNKLKTGSLSPDEMKNLIKNLKKESGIDYSDVLTSKKYVSPYAIGGAGLSLFSSTSRGDSGIVSGSPSPTPSGTSNIYFSDGYSPITPSPTPPTPSPTPEFDVFSAPSPSPDQSPPFSPSPSPSPTPPVPTPKPSSSALNLLKSMRDSRQGYDVGIIKKGKPKIIKKGLNRKDALDVGAKRVLKDLSATFFIRKSSKKAKDIPDTNIFNRFRNQFREPKESSKYKGLGEEVWIQKKRKIQGVGSRLGQQSEVKDILGFVRTNFKLGFSKSKKKKKKSIWDF